MELFFPGRLYYLFNSNLQLMLKIYQIPFNWLKKALQKCIIYFLFAFACLPLAFGQQLQSKQEDLIKAQELIDTYRYFEALQFLDAVIERDSSLAMAYLLRGRGRYMADFDEEALGDLNRALSLDSLIPLGHIYRGDIKRYLNDYAGAISDYSKALQSNPNSELAFVGRGIARFLTANDSISREDAIADLKGALNLNPLNYNAILGLSNMYFFYFDTQRSVEFLENTLKQVPITAKEYAAIAEVLLLVESQLDEDEFQVSDREKLARDKAILLYREAIQMDSLNINYLAKLANLLEDSGDYAASRGIYNKINVLGQNELKLNYNRRGRFYPYTELSSEDRLSYPIIPEIEFFLEEIYDFESSNDQPSLKFKYIVYSPYEQEYVASNGDTLKITDLAATTSVDFIQSNNTRIKELKKANWGFLGTSYEGALESSIIHNWDLRNYPFDIQKVKVVFRSQLDTTILKFKMSKKFYADFNKKMNGLREGFKIDTITFHNSFENGWELLNLSPVIQRKIVHPLGVFEIAISRTGSWLFLKLFMGAFLACCLSWLAFTLKTKSFSSQIELSVGAVFGAIGNKYFVEATTPLTQILTKADLLNNLAIVVVLLNTFLIILMHKEKFKPGRWNLNRIFLLLSFVFTLFSVLLIIYI